MTTKVDIQKVTGIVTVVASILAVVFLFKQQYNIAVALIAFTFTLTNALRAKDMNAKGYVKEAKVMRFVAIFFSILTILAVVSLFF